MSGAKSLPALTEAIRRAERELETITAQRDALLIRYVLDEGWTHEVAAAAFEISRQRVSQIIKRHKATKHGRAMTPAEALREARDAFRNAQHAQALRCESATGMAREEVRAFYGDPNVSQGDVVEDRVRWAGFYESESAARERWEGENVA